MALQPDYVAGTITLESGEIDFTTEDAALITAAILPGDQILLPAKGLVLTIATITGENAGTLTDECPAAAAGEDQAYRIRRQSDLSRVAEYTRQLIMSLASGNITSFAALDGTGGDLIPFFTGPGALGLLTRQDLTQGVRYDVQVANIAARAAYNSEAVGFAVLVSNTGDGRSAIYTRTGSAGTWTDPAYITGPAVTMTVDEVDEVPYGTPPSVTLESIAGGYKLDFEIPKGMILQPGTLTPLAPGTPPTASFVAVTGGYRLDLGLPSATVLVAGTVQTIAPDLPAEVNFVAVTGGYRLDFKIPKGPTGDIDGVTSFWVARLGSDTTREAARIGLDAAKRTPAEIAKMEPSLDLVLTGKGAVRPGWFTRASAGSYFDSQGILRTAAANEPRYDHDPATGLVRGLLLEGTRTNFAQRNEELDNAYWTKVRASITANAAIAPDGAMTADKLVEDTTASNTHVIHVAQTVVAGSANLFEFFAKPAERSRIFAQISNAGGTSGIQGRWDLGSGTLTSVSPTGTGSDGVGGIEKLWGGWYYCWVGGIIDAGSTSAIAQIAPMNAAGSVSYTGDGASGLHLWRPQVEPGRVRSSSIFTPASANVTRSADVLRIPASANFPLDNLEGTLVLEFHLPMITSGILAQISDGTANNLVGIVFYDGPAFPKIYGSLTVAGSTGLAVGYGSITAGAYHKVALAWTDGSQAIALDGALVDTDTQAIPAGLNRIDIGGGWNGAGPAFGHISRATYFPRRLSNTILQEITR